MCNHQHPGIAPQMVPCHGYQPVFHVMQQTVAVDSVCAMWQQNLLLSQTRAAREGPLEAVGRFLLVASHCGDPAKVSPSESCWDTRHETNHMMCPVDSQDRKKLGKPSKRLPRGSCPHRELLRRHLACLVSVLVRALEGSSALLGIAEGESQAAVACEGGSTANDIGISTGSSDNA